MSSNVKSVVIDIRQAPIVGVSALLVRCSLDDRQDISKAAKMLGMSRATFARTVLVQVARKLLADAPMGED